MFFPDIETHTSVSCLPPWVASLLQLGTATMAGVGSYYTYSRAVISAHGSQTPLQVPFLLLFEELAANAVACPS